jgi:NADPH:quinone reductase-like Zn-dependent oxidoreductase
MRAIVNAQVGVEFAEVLEPVPAPGEAVIAVAAAGINRGELALLAARPAGWRPGQDIAGTVLAAAADGSGPAVGARVAGLVEGGGWAERVAVPVGSLAELPNGVDFSAAATLGIAGRTALRTVALGGNLLGRRVLITGAGAVGRFQAQVAALAGAEVVVVSSGKAALPGYGATAVVAEVGAASGLFDLVLDTVGGRTLAAAVSKVAPGGTVLLIGVADREPAQISLTDFFGHENAVIRSYFSYAQPDPPAADLATMVRLLDAGGLTAPIGLRVGWDQVNKALAALAEGKVGGKAVLELR